MKTFPVFLVLVVLFVFAVFAEDADTKIKEYSVLLSFEETKFKSALIKEMKGLLEKDSFKVVVANHTGGGNLTKHSASDYNAVFVTNSGINSNVRPWVLEWLKENESVVSRIILHTTQIRKWEVKTPVKVDAITSASANGKVKSMAVEYVNKLKSLLKPSQALSQQ